ncbi:MAG: SGNH/GDSL hydrolase family protein [Clostridia bacterium]|nr:SGNH/GDSL hydrolase family protein [Clostridia bacterium]
MNYSLKTLAVFGDSIMYGSGNNGFGVGEFLAKDYGFKLIKYCIGGARTGYYEGKNWIIDQVRQAISDGIKPDYIIFNGFTNDCYKTDGENYDVPLGEVSSGFDGFDIFAVSKENTTFSNCFENILCAFKKYFPNAKLLFMRPHNMGRREEVIQKVYGERAVELCKKWGVAVADIYENSGLNTFLPEHRDLYTNDSYGWGIGDSTHPNTLGYEKFYMPIIEKKLKEL